MDDEQQTPKAGAPEAITFRIRHTTTYGYQSLVTIAHNEARLAPRDTPQQRSLGTRFTIEPEPVHIGRHRDYFGNWVHDFTLDTPHTTFSVTAHSRATVQPPEVIDPNSTPPWEEVVAQLAAARDAETLEAFELCFRSPLVRWNDAIREYALKSFTPGRPLLAATLDLNHRIFTEFTYKPGVTNITTPITEVFEDRKGVCQDFAQFAVGCLRSVGLSSRYVSGYLLTHPPPGQPKRVGADESHAWASVYCPGHGFIDFDPTNDVRVTQEHITVGWGRDFGDVSPLKGVVLGGGGHRVSVSVDVAPVASTRD